MKISPTSHVLHALTGDMEPHSLARAINALVDRCGGGVRLVRGSRSLSGLTDSDQVLAALLIVSGG